MNIEWATIKKFACGEASPEEAREVREWAAGSPARRSFLNDSIKFYAGERTEEELLAADVDRAWRRADPSSRRMGRRIVTWAAASAAVVALSVGVYFLTNDVRDAAAPENLVRITVPDGSAYDIGADAAIPGFVVTGDGSLSQIASARPESDTSYIEVRVPCGQTHDITIADGTRVKLNAGSSFRFPASFAGTERRVALSGEGWFEVAADPDKPFLIDAAGATVRVLGTDFNVRAYDSEASSVVLVSGSVEIGTELERRTLVPGQQCDITGGELSVREADMATALAWRDDEFAFRDAALNEITEELARWYDVEVVYRQPELRQERFYVFVRRSQTLAEVMDKIAKTGRISYDINDGRLTISR